MGVNPSFRDQLQSAAEVDANVDGVAIVQEPMALTMTIPVTLPVPAPVPKAEIVAKEVVASVLIKNEADIVASDLKMGNESLSWPIVKSSTTDEVEEEDLI